ncbi:MAG: AAA family ATPase [Candidatus Wallbacteria bacterium]|nr:AAA family ATPase [Candidatus Wallbacteria bacterium]
MKDRASRQERGRRLSSEVLEPMKRAFVGKDEIVDLMGVCLVAGENLFLLGPPGTAKSALVRELGHRLEGRTFEYLLTRFTEPSELFGPFDIRKLKEGELITNTEGMLPEASLVFLDELLNANSAILNSLLMVLNERVFRRGKETRQLPALMVVGASNRLPEDDALGALFDRFLLRVACDNVAEERLPEVLDAGWRLDLGLHLERPTVDIETVRELHGALSVVELGGVRPAIVDMVTKLRRAGIPISDRRAVKLQRLVAASALVSGREQASVSDMWVFRHIWDSVEQQQVLAEIVDSALKKTPADPSDHPRAREGGAPDAEALARDLETIAQRLSDAATSAADRSVLRDRLGVLAARSQWVRDQEARTVLSARIEALWPRFEQRA